MKVLLITTLQIESEALLNRIKQERQFVIEYEGLLKKTYLFNTKINEKIEIKILELGQIGNIEAGIKTFQALTLFKPNLVILTGICGGFKKNKGLSLGDIILPSYIVYYELGKIKKDRVDRRFKTIRIDKDLLKSVQILIKEEKKNNSQELNLINNEFTPEVFFKPMLTGEKIIATEKFYNELSFYYPDIVATEMESYGVAQAILYSNVNSKFLVIKSIGDWADNTKSDNYQKVASSIASEFVITLIKTMEFKEKTAANNGYKQ